MRLAKVNPLIPSSPGVWALRDLPGLCVYRNSGEWGFWGYEVKAGVPIVERLWPNPEQRGSINDGREWLKQHPRLNRKYRTRWQALDALQTELQASALKELLCP